MQLEHEVNKSDRGPATSPRKDALGAGTARRRSWCLRTLCAVVLATALLATGSGTSDAAVVAPNGAKAMTKVTCSSRSITVSPSFTMERNWRGSQHVAYQVTVYGPGSTFRDQWRYMTTSTPAPSASGISVTTFVPELYPARYTTTGGVRVVDITYAWWNGYRWTSVTEQITNYWSPASVLGQAGGLSYCMT